MKSETLGINISGTEVTNVSSHGVWLLSNGKELFMPYKEFPWFKVSSIYQVLNVEEISPGHFYWPDLDIDLSIETIEHPERFPLKSINA